MADAAISHDGKRQSTGEEQVANRLKRKRQSTGEEQVAKRLDRAESEERGESEERSESERERAHNEAVRKFHETIAAEFLLSMETPQHPPLEDGPGSDEEVEAGHDYVAGVDEDGVKVTGSDEDDVEVEHYVAGEDEDENDDEVEVTGSDEDEIEVLYVDESDIWI